MSKGCLFSPILKTKKNKNGLHNKVKRSHNKVNENDSARKINLNENQDSALCDCFGQTKHDRSTVERMSLFTNTH